MEGEDHEGRPCSLGLGDARAFSEKAILAREAMKVKQPSLLSLPVASHRRTYGRRLRSSHLLDACLRLGDLGIVSLVAIGVSLWRYPDWQLPDVVTASTVLGIMLAAHAFVALGVYRLPLSPRGVLSRLPQLLGGWGLSIAGVLILLFGMKASSDLSRLWLGFWFVGGAAGLIVWRLGAAAVLVRLQRAGRLRRRVLVVGQSRAIAESLGSWDRDGGVTIAGCLCLDGEVGLPPWLPRLVSLDALEATARSSSIDHIVLVMPWAAIDQLQPVIDRLRMLPVEVTLHPVPCGRPMPILGTIWLGNSLQLRLLRRPLDEGGLLLKAVEDRVLAALLLLFAGPLMLLIALAVRLTSPGPALYRQLRRGFNGQPIEVLKFRTMYAEACDPLAAAEVRQATQDDARVTPFGRILRRTSLDELPQLLNVLLGDMSLVGPRPHAMAHDELFSGLVDNYLGRHRVKPGITGWAQINGYRGEIHTAEEIKHRINYDMHYIDNWSISFDIYIILKTFGLMFYDRKAY